MDKLTHNVQIAVIKVLTEIQKADNVVRDKEIDYLKDVMLSFGLCDENLSDVNDTSTSQAISIIKELPAENKNEIATAVNIKFKGYSLNQVITGSISLNAVYSSPTRNKKEYMKITTNLSIFHLKQLFMGNYLSVTVSFASLLAASSEAFMRSNTSLSTPCLITSSVFILITLSILGNE